MIGRLIIKFDNKVYSILIESYTTNVFMESKEFDKVNLYFVDNPIIRKFYWDYMLPKHWIKTKKSIMIVDFLGKPYILSFIYIEDPIATGSSDFEITLIPLIEPPKLPPARFVSTCGIPTPQDFHML